MKKKFSNPEINFYVVKSADIIATSNIGGGDSDGDLVPGRTILDEETVAE